MEKKEKEENSVPQPMETTSDQSVEELENLDYSKEELQQFIHEEIPDTTDSIFHFLRGEDATKSDNVELERTFRDYYMEKMTAVFGTELELFRQV